MTSGGLQSVGSTLGPRIIGLTAHHASNLSSSVIVVVQIIERPEIRAPFLCVLATLTIVCGLINPSILVTVNIVMFLLYSLNTGMVTAVKLNTSLEHCGFHFCFLSGANLILDPVEICSKINVRRKQVCNMSTQFEYYVS